MNRLKILFLFVSFWGYSQNHGEIFPGFPNKPMEQVEYNGVIVVTRSLYGLNFEDNSIPKQYKKAVEFFFTKRFRGYNSLKKYRLKVAKKHGFIYIENQKMKELK